MLCLSCSYIFFPAPIVFSSVFSHTQHYSAIMKYISQPPLLLNVHMHNPTVSVRSWMDSLLAFFPGLQVSNTSIGHTDLTSWFNVFILFHTSKKALKMLTCTQVLRGDRSETSYWDPWDALPSDQTAQVSSWGRHFRVEYIFCYWLVRMFMYDLCSSFVFSVIKGFHYRVQSSLGPTLTETRVCRKHLLPLQGGHCQMA